MKRFFKRAASGILVLAMVVTLLQSLPGAWLTVAAEDGISPSVSDRIQIQVGDVITDMEVYLNGVYEAKVALPAGSHEAKLLVNGTETAKTDSVSVENDTEVYFRLKDGELVDSVNQDYVVHSVALVGNFWGIQFVDENQEAYNIGSWNPADENAELSYLGGGMYGRTFYMNELAEDVTVCDAGYKVAFDDSWDYSIGNGSGNIAVTIPAGTTQFTVLVDEINGVVYDSVRTPDFSIAQNSGEITGKSLATTISLIGDARGADDWNPSATGYEFTQISDTLYRYQKTFAKGTYNYKCVFNYANWYEAEAGNRSLNITSDQTNVVFLYNTTTGKLTDSINNTTDVATALGMATAPVAAEVIDLTNGKTQFVTVAETGAQVSLVYGKKAEVEEKGADALTKVSCKEQGEGVFSSGDIFFGDEAVDLVYYYEVNGTKTLDDSNEAVTVDGNEYLHYTRAKFTGRTVNVPGTFPGPSWDANSNVMTYQGNGLYSYTFKDVPAANYEFKIAFTSWSENYGVGGAQDGANYSLTVSETQDVTVYYSDFSHLAVTSIDYIFADITLSGTGIPEGTKLKDDGLTGIYSVTVPMEAGAYDDIQIDYDNEVYAFDTVEVEEAKDVTFYFDPSSEIYYNDASNDPIEEDQVYYNTKETACKSVYGAVATGEDVTFSLTTGTDISTVRMVVKGVEKKVLSLEKEGKAKSGTQKWSVTTEFSEIGENTYYFVLSNGSTVKIYADDDGYYGEGTITDLTNITPYELVVYQDGFETPDWMKDAVIYQIFPERFYDGDLSNDFAQTSARGAEDYEYVTDWYTLPENPDQEGLLSQEDYEATGAFYGDGNWSNEIYGGDLAGITERIDYLKALGINVIYINPVFSSISSHRYDTSDYELIDPVLGDLGDFKELVQVAEENGMHIVLDGVFNHVSDDSKYFDRYYKFLEAGMNAIGAYPYWAYVYDVMAEQGVSQSTAEDIAKNYFTEEYGITDYSYTEWFDVNNSYMTDDNGEVVTDTIGQRTGKGVYSYDGWWGYDSMPVVKSTNGSEYQTGNWADEIIYSEDGSSVTQYWLSEGSDGWRLDVANEVSDETWQKFRESVKALNSDAVIIGEIWDDATEYLLGDMYDSVMNYVFRNAVLSFAKGGTSTDAMNTLEKLRERYPQEAYYAMMNLVGSHDTARVLSYLDGIDDDRKDTSIAGAFPTYETTSDLAKERQYLVAFLQFTYAGAPTIYYGDEIGMVGADDPDDRRAFTWGQGNKELVTWYATLAEIRSSYTALRTGTVEPFDCNSNVIGYVRRDESDSLIVLANNSQEAQEVTLNLGELEIETESLTDVITGSTYEVTGNELTVRVPALNGLILAEQAKKITVNQSALAPAYEESYTIEERVLATSVSVDKKTLSLEKGKNSKISATVAPADATNGGEVVWTSSDEQVATVSANGVVTALKAGTVTITATATYSREQVKAICTVTVTDSSQNTGDSDNSGNENNSGSDNNSGSSDNSNVDNSNEDNSNSGNNNLSGDVTETVTDTTTNTATSTTTVTATQENVLETITNATEGSMVQMKVSSSADTISGAALNALAGKNVTLQVSLDNGITWKINGRNLKAGTNYDNIDLGVVLNSNEVPAALVEKIPDSKATVQLSLDYDGEFGFEMVMNVPIGAEYKGLYANLYYYNEATGALEFVTAVKIGEDGSADLSFEHASDYVIAISDKNLETTASAVKTGDETSMTAIWMLAFGMLVAGTGAIAAKRRKRNS
ncbi:MAG: alpha-amylase family glycosyl hydrolase [Roseburia sp.]